MVEKQAFYDNGFALLAAIWLLVLAGAIVALLMLRGLQASKSAQGEAELLKDKLAIEAALETVVAEWVIDGARSRWQQVGESSVDVDGVPVQITSSKENARIDLNAANLDTIDTALARAGVERNRRLEIIGSLQIARGGKRKLSDPAEVEALLAGGGRGNNNCLTDIFTLATGLAQPSVGSLTLNKAQFAIGTPAGDPIAIGEPVRLKLTGRAGQSAAAVLRVTGQRDVYQLITWGQGGSCI